MMATKKKRRPAATSKAATKKVAAVKDRTTAFALAVAKKKIIAGPSVRAACKRHLDDLKNAPARGFSFHLPTAEQAIDFFPDVLRLAGGAFEGKPFGLEGWEQFVIGSLFGWLNEDGFRRFRVAYAETGKGSGKSPLAAGIGLKMLCADKEPRAEVYAAATKRDQAAVLFRDAISMYDQSPELQTRLKSTGATGREWNLAHEESGSFFRPIATEDTGQGQSGPRPHCGLLDEVHEHKTNAMVEYLRAGFKWRRQPLSFMITNSGSDKKSPCGQYHDYAVKVANQTVQDDGFFSFVCDLDEGDDPFKDEKCWPKVNPSLPTIPGYEYLRGQVREAKGMPSKESLVRRLNFCEWVEAADPWISRDRWFACVKQLDLEGSEGARYKELPVAAAVDLSGKTDLTALTAVFGLAQREAFSWYWTPQDTLAERELRDRAPYSLWVRQGHLLTVPGRAINYAWVAKQVKDLNDNFNLQILAFDRWRIPDLLRELDELGVESYLVKVEVDEITNEPKLVPVDGNYHSGIKLLPHGQGFRDMGVAIDDLEAVLLEETLLIQENHVTNMCAASAVITKDAAGNRKFDKAKSTSRIDGMVSLAMANRAASFLEPIHLVDRSLYEDRGLRVI